MDAVGQYRKEWIEVGGEGIKGGLIEEVTLGLGLKK